MPIAIECRQCGQPYTAPERLAGRTIKCRNCAALLQIPRGAHPSNDDSLVSPAEAMEIHEAPAHFPKPFFPPKRRAKRLFAVREPCPACGQIILDEDPVCAHCGYVRRPARVPSQWVPWAIGIGIAAAATLVLGGAWRWEIEPLISAYATPAAPPELDSIHLPPPPGLTPPASQAAPQ